MENLSLLDVSWNRIRHIGSEDLKPFPNLRFVKIDFDIFISI
jgi:hypothetical protein